MELKQYCNLIKQLPYQEQAFETSKATWNLKKYQANKPFLLFCKEQFRNSEKVIISRGDLFKLCSCQKNIEAIFSIILWGYPRNMRGNLFEEILQHLDKLNQFVSANKSLTNIEFLTARNQLKGTGIGLSTLTKFLYFFNFYIDGYKSLILDSRIIKVLQLGNFKELSILNTITEINKDKHYINYLKIMSDIANANNYCVDQLELFLFIFGNNLKSNNG